MLAPNGRTEATDLRQWPYQIIVPEGEEIASLGFKEPTPLKAQFPALIPEKPYCADWPENGLQIRGRKVALKKRHLQLNSPLMIRWLPFDMDRADAALAHEDAYLPPPNFIAENPENKHTLSAYCLKVPVHNFAGSRSSPPYFLAAIERGLRRRLGADPNYVGVVAKNPLHSDWRVRWHNDPYTLGDLGSWLFERDMAFEPTVREETGFGRNCTVFDEVRSACYREILQFKRDGGSLDDWRCRCLALAVVSNRQFLRPLSVAELRAMAKSIAKWTWRKFSEHEFSRLQSYRGGLGASKRWADHISIESIQPWDTQGISRATWYRKRKRLIIKSGCADCQMISE
jgi:hypothetical protein